MCLIKNLIGEELSINPFFVEKIEETEGGAIIHCNGYLANRSIKTRESKKKLDKRFKRAFRQMVAAG